MVGGGREKEEVPGKKRVVGKKKKKGAKRKELLEDDLGTLSDYELGK